MNLPFYSRREHAESLMRILDHVANKTGSSRYMVAFLMTYFLEGIADEVARGNKVRLPGFGLFAASLVERKAALARDPTPRCRPAFSPSRGFVEQVRLTAPVSKSGKQAISNHRRNHSSGSRSTQCSARVFKSGEAVRASIKAQLAGFEPTE
jgi:nucleoid DNA-binding protein